MTACSEKKTAISSAMCGAGGLGRLFPYTPESSLLTVECPAADYSASSIARAVEDCDAHLLNLNVTSETSVVPGNVVVDLRVNHRNADAVSRSLERYGFIVTSTDAAMSSAEEKARGNALELLHYLEL
ncbi:MAG: hypothetical protein K2J97_01050 [Muribaculaceae bacterium]|nr:hypothetical protein [Muribaculaceae bacterium]